MHHPKNAHRVYLKLTSGKSMDGHLFMYDAERITDLLNDERLFIPFFNRQERKTLVINKSQIQYIYSLEEQ
ncbi:hypothetical protein GCM10009104_32100 [Marinobacterium maritimum]|uniref:Uncharacterized protein n=1 Tax=Marinobacterium maritimum TaxID=500162 RepID=A0ABN1IA12_9GAMM